MTYWNLHKKFELPMTNVHQDLTVQSWVFLIGGEPNNCSALHLKTGTLENMNKNKPIQDGGEAKAPLWLNRLSVTNWLTNWLTDGQGWTTERLSPLIIKHYTTPNYITPHYSYPDPPLPSHLYVMKHQCKTEDWDPGSLGMPCKLEIWDNNLRAKYVDFKYFKQKKKSKVLHKQI